MTGIYRQLALNPLTHVRFRTLSPRTTKYCLPCTPPCARESHPPVIESHTEPVSNEPIYLSTLAIGEASKDAIRTKQQYRKLSAVEHAEVGHGIRT